MFNPHKWFWPFMVDLLKWAWVISQDRHHSAVSQHKGWYKHFLHLECAQFFIYSISLLSPSLKTKQIFKAKIHSIDLWVCPGFLIPNCLFWCKSNQLKSIYSWVTAEYVSYSHGLVSMILFNTHILVYYRYLAKTEKFSLSKIKLTSRFMSSSIRWVFLLLSVYELINCYI